MNPEDEAEEDGANIDLDSQRKGKCVVLKTSTRQVSNLFSDHQRHFFCCSFFFVYVHMLCAVHLLNI
jgi:hypothetical protein